MSIVDEETAATLNSGRETIGAVLSTVQTHLQKVFIVFVIGFIGTFYALRAVIWDWLKAVTESRMGEATASQHEIIVQTPFEVILLQAKIGIIVGIIIAIPPLLYLSRHELRARGYWPETPVARWKIAGLALLASVLFVGGVTYAYGVFFPVILGFLATNALGAGVAPTWSIVMWTEFLILLTISFGLAAQLPLVMSALAYAEIVPYETFRDKWRYAILGIFVFGAFFSPPDPISQVMWAVPLVVLYAFSLTLTKFVVSLKVGAAQIDVGDTFRTKWNRIIAAPLLVGAAAYAAIVGWGEYLYREVVLPYGLGRYVPELAWAQTQFGISRTEALGITVGVVAFVTLALALFAYYLYASIDLSTTAPARPDAPSELDIDELDAEGIRAAPIDPFMDLSEDEALGKARAAIDDDDHERAQAILDRFDEAQAAKAEEGGTESDEPEGGATPTAAEGTAEAAESEGEGGGGVVEETTTGMLAAFSEEKDEDDIGGYLYDLRFVVSSLRSKAFRIAAVFGIAMVATFTFLYQGGLGLLKEDFISRIPQAVQPEEVAVIALHPVEVLIFEIKVSTLAGAIVAAPLALYYAWPALKDRNLVRGRRRVIYSWALALFTALAVGTLIGYLYVAPAVMSYLVFDAVRAGMIISYRINKFSWLIIYTTVGVGLLASVPITMWMCYRGGIFSYRTMRERWREVTIAVFAIAGVFTPVSVLTMFLVAIPIMIAYGIGLGGLWIVTLGGRRDWSPEESASTSTAETDGGFE